MQKQRQHSQLKEQEKFPVRVKNEADVSSTVDP